MRYARLKVACIALAVTATKAIRFARFVYLACMQLSPGDRVTVRIYVQSRLEQHMHRFNIDLPEEMHKSLRIAAAEKNVTMRQLIITSLEKDYGTSKAQSNLTDTAQKQKRATRKK